MKNNATFKIVAAIGGALIVIGTFSPVINAPIVGSVSLIRLDVGDAYTLILLAVIGAGLCLASLRWAGLATGILSLAIVGYAYSQVDARISALSNRDLNNPFLEGFARSVSPGYGFAFLFLGGLALAISAFLFERLQSRESQIYHREENERSSQELVGFTPLNQTELKTYPKPPPPQSKLVKQPTEIKATETVLPPAQDASAKKIQSPLIPTAKNSLVEPEADGFSVASFEPAIPPHILAEGPAQSGSSRQTPLFDERSGKPNAGDATAKPRRPAYPAALIGGAILAAAVVIGCGLYFGLRSTRPVVSMTPTPNAPVSVSIASETLSGLLDSANTLNGDEFEAISTTAANLKDWFFLKSDMRWFAVPKEFADTATLGCRVFKFRGVDVGQILAKNDKEVLMFLFHPADLDVKIEKGKWAIVAGENWVGGVTVVEDCGFIVAFKGKRGDMQSYLDKYLGINERSANPAGTPNIIQTTPTASPEIVPNSTPKDQTSTNGPPVESPSPSAFSQSVEAAKQKLSSILGVESDAIDVQENGSGQIVQITLTKHEPQTFHGGECYDIILTVLRGAELPVGTDGIPGVTIDGGVWKDSVTACDVAETGDFQFTVTQNGKVVLTAHWQGNGTLAQFVIVPLVAVPLPGAAPGSAKIPRQTSEPEPTATPPINIPEPTEEQATAAFNDLQDRLHKPHVPKVWYIASNDSFNWIGPKFGKKMSMSRNQFDGEVWADYYRKLTGVTSETSGTPKAESTSVQTSGADGTGQTNLVMVVNQALESHDWQTLTKMTVDRLVNYFDHKHATNAFIAQDMQSDSRTYAWVKSIPNANTFTHEVSDQYSSYWSGPMLYDSITVYSEAQEKNGKLHKATTRLTVGYVLDSAGHPAIYSLTLKIL
jgi:hypothetical protein